MNLNVGFTENAESFAAGLNKNKKDFDAKYSDVKLIPGKDGKDGFSPIVTVESIFGGHRVTITDASGTQVFDVMNGEDGSPGATGSPGAAGSPGKDGYSPSVTVVPITGGNRVTITDANGIKTFDVMDGSDGKDGNTGPAGKDGLPGTPGKDGKDGVSVSHKWNGTVLEVTSASGTSSADLRGEQGIQGVQGIQGERGLPGTPGEDGYSPTVSIATITGGHRVTIADATGTQTFDIIDGVNGKDGSPGTNGYTPKKGVDYFTSDDKSEFVQSVINALPVYNGEVVSA